MARESSNFEGLILRNINFKDSDKIYSIFVRGLGKISAKAKGVRKFSSKRLSLLDSLNLVKIGLVGEHELKTITEVSLLNSFKHIKSDFNKLKTSLYLLELVSSYLNESSEYDELFELLIKCLMRLEETSYSDSRIENYFEYQFLKISGYELNLFECSFCSSTITEGRRFNFNYDKGGVVCEDCSSSYNFYSKAHLQSLMMLNNYKVVDGMDFSEIDKVLKSYINQILPETPKTTKFFGK